MKSIKILHAATVIATILACLTALPAQTKRPLRHTDYDAWRDIHSQRLSPDGNYVAYGLFPQQGDGEVVVRNLKTGAEWRTPAGARPEPSRPDPALENPVEDERPQRPNITVQFTPDSRFVVFSTFAPKAERGPGQTSLSRCVHRNAPQSPSRGTNTHVSYHHRPPTT